jgi:hypothetical protein
MMSVEAMAELTAILNEEHGMKLPPKVKSTTYRDDTAESTICFLLAHAVQVIGNIVAGGPHEGLASKFVCDFGTMQKIHYDLQEASHKANAIWLGEPTQ